MLNFDVGVRKTAIDDLKANHFCTGNSLANEPLYDFRAQIEYGSSSVPTISHERLMLASSRG